LAALKVFAKDTRVTAEAIYFAKLTLRLKALELNEIEVGIYIKLILGLNPRSQAYQF